MNVPRLLQRGLGRDTKFMTADRQSSSALYTKRGPFLWTIWEIANDLQFRGGRINIGAQEMERTVTIQDFEKASPEWVKKLKMSVETDIK